MANTPVDHERLNKTMQLIASVNSSRDELKEYYIKIYTGGDNEIA